MIRATQPKDYELAPEGQYSLKVKKIIDQPQVTTPYGPKDKLLFVYEVQGTKDKLDGFPLTVAQSYYNGLGTKVKPSKLRKDIEKILGRRLSGEEMAEGFDEQQLFGLTVLADIVHNHSDANERTYANIDELYKNRKDTPPAPAYTPEQPPDNEVPF